MECRNWVAENAPFIFAAPQEAPAECTRTDSQLSKSDMLPHACYLFAGSYLEIGRSSHLEGDWPMGGTRRDPGEVFAPLNASPQLQGCPSKQETRSWVPGTNDVRSEASTAGVKLGSKLQKVFASGGASWTFEFGRP